ncbi:MAG: hypothetical protein ACXWV5_07970 [Flavitalea sp.]
MKKILTLILICLTVSFSAIAQEETKAEVQRLEAYKIAYLTKKLNLSPGEAQKFWPLYNKYQEEVKNLRIDSRQDKNSEIEVEEKMLNIRKKYNGEFSKALNNDKVNTLFKSEREFSLMVQKELMERRQQKLDQRRRKN